MKLGKLPARKDSITFKFTKYATKQLAAPPAAYGDLSRLAELPWGMLGNDQYGDCVWAGAGHETMNWNEEAGKEVSITETNVLNAYSAVTGFNPDDPNSDKGTDMQVAASYRVKTGILDVSGAAHKVDAYLAITGKKEIMQAIAIFSAAGIGVEFPDSAMEQFNAGKPWTVVKGAKIDGGHYVPGLAYDKTYLYVVTWGKLQRAKWSWITKYMDEGIVYLSEEFLNGGKTINGFDLTTLRADLALLK